MIELSRSVRQRFINIAWLHGTDEIWVRLKWMIKTSKYFYQKKDILSSEDGLSKDIETEK